jgi:hypothetical protein
MARVFQVMLVYSVIDDAGQIALIVPDLKVQFETVVLHQGFLPGEIIDLFYIRYLSQWTLAAACICLTWQYVFSMSGYLQRKIAFPTFRMNSSTQPISIISGFNPQSSFKSQPTRRATLQAPGEQMTADGLYIGR